MKIKELFQSTAVRLAFAIVIGIALGLLVALFSEIYKEIIVQVLLVLNVLVCIIAIGSPGVPGGINMSCSSLVMSIVLASNAPEMGDQFFAVMTAIYTIQDGFGTACNITCDGALTLITDTYLKRINNKGI